MWTSAQAKKAEGRRLTAAPIDLCRTPDGAKIKPKVRSLLCLCQLENALLELRGVGRTRRREVPISNRS